MSETTHITTDGNAAAARIAYGTNEVVAISPTAPASPMGELADQWSAEGRPVRAFPATCLILSQHPALSFVFRPSHRPSASP